MIDQQNSDVFFEGLAYQSFRGYKRQLTTVFPLIPLTMMKHYLNSNRNEGIREVIILVGGMFCGIFMVTLLDINGMYPDFRYYYQLFQIDNFTEISNHSADHDEPKNNLEDIQNILDNDCFVQISKTKQVRIHDIDRNGHMNNSKYLYELNFTRKEYFKKLGVWSILTRNNVNLIIQAQMIRYRSELKLWDNYQIITRIIGWSEEEHSFYVESKFVSSKNSKINTNKFIMAIHYCKYRLVVNKTHSNFFQVTSPEWILIQSGLLPYDYIENKGLNYVDKNVSINEGNNVIELWEKSNRLSSSELNPSRLVKILL
eukprot:gene9545-12856_t